MTWYIHLAIASEPGGPLSAICGAEVRNPVPVTLGPETESPLDFAEAAQEMPGTGDAGRAEVGDGDSGGRRKFK